MSIVSFPHRALSHTFDIHLVGNEQRYEHQQPSVNMGINLCIPSFAKFASCEMHLAYLRIHSIKKFHMVPNLGQLPSLCNNFPSSVSYNILLTEAPSILEYMPLNASNLIVKFIKYLHSCSKLCNILPADGN